MKRFILLLLLLMPLAYGAEVLYWDFDTAHISGNTVYDQTGSYDGTRSGATYTTSDCLSGGCVDFSGAHNHHITTSYTLPTTDTSICFYMKLDNAPGDTTYILRTSTSYTYILSEASTSDNVQYATWASGWDYVSDTSRLTDTAVGDWTHYCFVHAGGTNDTIRIWRDASLIATTINANDLSSSPTTLYLGSDSSSKDSIDGRIDEFKIFSHALSGSEISALMLGSGSNQTINVFHLGNSSHVGNMTFNYTCLSCNHSGVLNGSSPFSVDFNDTQNYTFTFNGRLSNAETISYNVTINQSFYSFYLRPYNLLNITLIDEDTGANITTNISLNLLFNGSTSSYSNDTGGFVFPLLSDGTHRVHLYSALYTDRYYYVTMAGGVYMTLTAYLSNSTNSEAKTFYMKCSGSALANVTISAQKLIGGSYVTVAQRLSDGSGTASIYLNPSTDYRFNFVHPSEGTYTTDITPSESSYTVDICTGESGQPYNWTTQNDLYTYLLTPQSIILNQTSTLFTLAVSSPGGAMAGFGMWYNSSKNESLTSSPSGGSVNFTLDLSNKSGVIPIHYWFNASGDGYKEYTKYYRIDSIGTPGNYSAVALVEVQQTNISGALGYFLATVFTFIIMAMLKFAVPPVANAIIGFISMVIWGLLGWVSMLYLFPVGAFIALYAILEGR